MLGDTIIEKLDKKFQKFSSWWVVDFKGRGERRGMNNNAVMDFLPRRCGSRVCVPEAL